MWAAQKIREANESCNLKERRWRQYIYLYLSLRLVNSLSFSRLFVQFKNVFILLDQNYCYIQTLKISHVGLHINFYKRTDSAKPYL